MYLQQGLAGHIGPTIQTWCPAISSVAGGGGGGGGGGVGGACGHAVHTSVHLCVAALCLSSIPGCLPTCSKLLHNHKQQQVYQYRHLSPLLHFTQ